ncbi:hypothetical protein Vadar_015450 [Vaccinium darrowii]|uniref:Uncharacterized protein n=1 Tax=Vaccinium darrowii TaxID=229202 RepID=A0ACB7YWN8_9ERIC|nr:hypothetical protein Vadar_015450 [Vaccinium darrowii]
MEGENTVTLHGMKRSPYSFTVEMALKIKGIPYKFVEEDLKNKSELLLKYNPVHKKIPILVHNGNPILESLVIVEYIDETWKDNGPQLLPQDPYTRAQVRFWTSFVHQQLFVALRQVLISEGEAQEKAIKEAIDTLKVVEEGMLVFFPTTPITNENQLGFLDIVMCSILGSYKAFEEVIGAKLINPERNPLVFSRMEAMIELPGVKEMRLTHEKTVAMFQFLRDEDLRNKSELLLKYNPVHKKVPILVHNGQPLVESLVILEYIDEIWKDNGPQLLPQDPYNRAKVRFWANFLHQQVFAPIFQVITEEGEAQEKAIKEEIDALKVMEEGMLEFFPTTPITNENQLGFLDIVICSVLGHHKAIEEAIGVKLVDPERNPLVFSWMEALTELPAVKQIRPSHEQLVAFIHFIKDNLKPPKA